MYPYFLGVLNLIFYTLGGYKLQNPAIEQNIISL